MLTELSEVLTKGWSRRYKIISKFHTHFIRLKSKSPFYCPKIHFKPFSSSSKPDIKKSISWSDFGLLINNNLDRVWGYFLIINYRIPWIIVLNLTFVVKVSEISHHHISVIFLCIPEILFGQKSFVCELWPITVIAGNISRSPCKISQHLLGQNHWQLLCKTIWKTVCDSLELKLNSQIDYGYPKKKSDVSILYIFLCYIFSLYYQINLPSLK